MKAYSEPSTDFPIDLRQIYRGAADAWRDKVFIRENRNGSRYSYTFGKLADDVDALGTALRARGWTDKKILLMGENCYAWVVSYLAIVCGLGTVVPVDREASERELAHIAAFAEASAVLCSDACAARIHSAELVLDTVRFSDLPALIREGNRSIINGDRTYLDAVIDPDAMHMLLFTSGTARSPKGVMLSHRNICFNLSQICDAIRVTDQDTFLSVLPLHHVYECTCGLFFPLFCGATVAFGDGMRQLTRSMQDFQPTVMLCWPLLVDLLHQKLRLRIQQLGLQRRVARGIRLSSTLPTRAMRAAARRRSLSAVHELLGGKLRLVISGGAAANPDALRGLRELGICAYQGYGLTECAPLVALNRENRYKDDSAGLPTSGALFDVHDMREDGIGEIRYKGGNIMLGYYKDPALTAKTIRDGWFYTGDLGYIDEDGFLFITGRKKDVIVTASGKSVFPEELENALNRTPFVKESVVVGCFNPRKQDHDVVAVIVPDRARFIEQYGSTASDERLDLELRRAISDVNTSLHPYKHVKTYLLRAREIPRNSLQKIKRAEIIGEARAEYGKRFL
ncbi:MAG: AMP-binding protein [Clostridia bacterium]|nr:AMP-binding protein [Clostridia bacterium]MBQ9774392.1 AMP-binding protein [Clostridia bacterium]